MPHRKREVGARAISDLGIRIWDWRGGEWLGSQTHGLPATRGTWRGGNPVTDSPSAPGRDCLSWQVRLLGCAAVMRAGGPLVL